MRNSFLNRKIRYSYFNATVILIGINLLVYLMTDFMRLSIRGVPLKLWLSLVPGMVLRGCLWQIFTYMFVHAGLSHIFWNMLVFFIFGIRLERELGSWEFLIFYLLSGFLSGLISFLIYLIGGMNVILMGASGAIYAVLFMFAVMFPHTVFLLFWFVPVPAPIAVLVFAGVSVFGQLFSDSSTAHLTHLAGFAMAWAYARIRFRIKPLQVWRQSLGH